MNSAVKTEKALREEAVDWLLRLRDQPGDETLEDGFRAWLAKDQRHAGTYERVRCLMGDTRALVEKDSTFLADASRKRNAVRTRRIGIAVAATLIAGGLGFSDIATRLQADHMSGTAERRTITAPDGSRLTLNANTAVALRFSQRERRVVLLRGEVLAQVATDTARPFVVEAGEGETTALGTVFNVNMLDDGTSVTVVEHSVMVETRPQRQPSLLKENQQIDYTPDGRLEQIVTVDSASVASWKEGRFIFEDKPLSEVVETFGRYLPGRIVISHAALRGKRLSGNFDLSDPQEALTALTAAFDIGTARLGPYLTVLY